MNYSRVDLEVIYSKNAIESTNFYCPDGVVQAWGATDGRKVDTNEVSN